MVRALLEGRKTQTRRAFKPGRPVAPTAKLDGLAQVDGNMFARFHTPWADVVKAMGWRENPAPSWSVETTAVRCPYGVPGDRLWVKETWNYFDPDPGPDGDLEVVGAERFARGKRAPWSGCQGPREIRWTAVYRADGDITHPKDGRAMWRPSIYMPRWASRITLEVTEVRVQRLHDISGADAYAEGCSEHGPEKQGLAVHEFARLWRQINGSPS